MVLIDEKTALIGISDLRTELPRLTEKAKLYTIIITKKGKPIYVLESFDEHRKEEKMLDTFEDIILGYIAKERFEHTGKSDYISHKQMKKII